MANNLNKPELLAPAGGREQLEYALHFGADAVYLACDKYGLRAAATNFTLDELPGAVQLAHEHGARVYVTCNAYAHDGDLDELPAYARAIEAAGADAVLVSDLGVMAVIHEAAPNLELHVSTQASVSNSAAARAWYALGARRVVCAREMSLAEIAQMRTEIPEDMEIEVFVHGAMCMAISGRCLISDYLTGRGANRGACVQPCRWEFSLHEPSRPGQEFPLEQDEDGSYLMSSKDLCMLEHLDELAAAGVDSIKIEGRNKKAFYVASVVNAYRHVLDGEPASEWMGELELVSHRPYSTGFYYGPAQQAPESSGYTQLADWVGEVVASQPAGEVFRTELLCRNRFYPGDRLEVLSPHCPVRAFEVGQVAEVFADGNEVPAEVVSKAMSRYVLQTPFQLREHDILRVRRKDPSKKN